MNKCLKIINLKGYFSKMLNFKNPLCMGVQINFDKKSELEGVNRSAKMKRDI